MGFARENNKIWFALTIIRDERKENGFKGILTDEGSLSASERSIILTFHKVGNEYWGKIKASFSSFDPCKVSTDGRE